MLIIKELLKKNINNYFIYNLMFIININFKGSVQIELTL